MLRLNTTDQKIALTSMELIILRFFTPKRTMIKVPPIGVKNKGVKNAIPISPYFLQIVTIRRFFRENFGRGLTNFDSQ